MSPSAQPANPILRHLRANLAAASIVLAALQGWAPSAAAEPASVSTVTFADVASAPVYSAPATVVARNAPDIAAQLDARVLSVPVEVGDRVAQGDVLASLDCRQYRAVLDGARAELQRATALQTFANQQLARARDLRRKKSISEELLDQRRTDLATAQADREIRAARLRQAEIDVDHCALRAPFDAVVTRREVSVGSYAHRGTMMFSLLETAGQEVSVALRHDQARTLPDAHSVRLEVEGTRYALQLRALLPGIDPTTRTREARLQFSAQTAPPGAAGRLVWRGNGRLLPADLLVRRNGELGVFVLDDDVARFLALPGAQDGRPVSADLAPSTLLVRDGRQRLDDGDRVRPVEPPG